MLNPLKYRYFISYPNLQIFELNFKKKNKSSKIHLPQLPNLVNKQENLILHYHPVNKV